MTTTQSSVLSTQSYQPTRWLITGGCGFIGTSLIKRLVEHGGHFVRVVDNLTVGTRDDLARVCRFTEIQPSSLSTQSSVLSTQLSPQSSALSTKSSVLGTNTVVELCVGDILDEKLALQAAQGMDIIVHLAANTGVAPSVDNPRMDCLTNVIGTLNYLEAARHNSVKRFVFASSGAPAGEVEPPIHEELPPHPVSPYGASKLAGEGYCSAYYRTYGVETVALRFGNVYGPGSGHKSSVVAKFIRRAMRGEPLEIYGDGKQTRDFIYIDDLVDAIYKAATLYLDKSSSPTQSSALSPQHSTQSSSIGGEIFQIATSKETTVGELVDILVLILREAEIENIQIRHEEQRLGDVRRNFSDTTKAKNLLGWEARVGLEEGLIKTVAWFVASRQFRIKRRRA
ncbi:NAD-dependent epimerase/dehydratase family protein [Desulfovulcanus sp.]